MPRLGLVWTRFGGMEASVGQAQLKPEADLSGGACFQKPQDIKECLRVHKELG